MNTLPADDLRESRALNTHLQSSMESDRTRLSRQLHDELGGLMVSTAMDLYAVSQRLPKTEYGQRELARARETIQTAIDLNRRMVDSLRPSILDHIGLFAALRWQLKEWGRMNDGKECGTSDALASMQHRLFMLGGTFTILHKSGRPTVMTASMPLSQLADLRH